jgi:prepilin-type processing-associated H-X9-DG protein
MPISFSCPHCGLETTVADRYAGQSGSCPRCGKPIVYPPPKPASKVAILIFVLAVALVVLVLWPPGVVIFPRTARRAQCQNNLKQIGLALLSYEQANGAFPPAAFTDDRGKPTISWRVAILPYMEHSDIYRAFDVKQSWDSAKNRVPGNIHLEDFRCPSDPGTTAGSAETNYVRIVGKDTVGGMPNEAVKISDITDGTSNTIMVAEVSGMHIHWAEPRDVTVDEFMELVAKGHASFHSGGFQAVFADGSVHFISNAVNPKTLRALLLRNDGQPVGEY